MKNKFILLLALFSGLASWTSAQEEQEESNKKNFRFIYIAPDNNMSQQGLLTALNDHRNYTIAEGSPAIFYLAFAHDPIIVKFNMDGDNSDDFDTVLLYTLKQSMSTNVEASYDRQRIMELITEQDFIDNEQKNVYENVEFVFHVGKTFWDRGNNEAVIASLFFELNIARYMDEGWMKFFVNFRCPPSKGSFDREKPFGELNLDNINTRIIPQSEN